MQVEQYKPWSFEEAADVINKGIARRCLVIIAGSMIIEYEGRGSTKLTEGERIVLIKRDGSIIVHRPEGYSPSNWQPETSTITTTPLEDCLRLEAIRRSPREVLRIVFTKPPVITLYCNVVDKGEFIEYLDETSLKELIIMRPDLLEKGLRIIEKEKPVKEGFIDLYGVDAKGRLVVIDAVLQLKRYVDSIRETTGRNDIRGILVAPNLTKQASTLIRALKLEWKMLNLKHAYKLYKSISSRGLGTHIPLDKFASQRE